MIGLMGRPRKGDRVPIAAKPERPLAEVIQRNATLLGLSYGDYLVYIAANALDMPEHAPQPTKSLDTLEGMRPESSPTSIPLPFTAAGGITRIVNAEELRHRIAS
ncbi:hypothetical protein DEA06_14730 [Microbacterium sp. Gd 4-13]|nr:hypothetical protein DEA06_14730 [Microbacterium sp. Gd 4-13]